jgi:hypothetical protein
MKVGDLVRIGRRNALLHNNIGLIIGLCAPAATRQDDVWRVQLCDNTLVPDLGDHLLFLTRDLEIISEAR